MHKFKSLKKIPNLDQTSSHVVRISEGFTVIHSQCTYSLLKRNIFLRNVLLEFQLKVLYTERKDESKQKTLILTIFQ